MKEINIAQTIIDKRKEKGITQEDLAEYIGVSKASVSKWETGQSYPDITLLPQLAAFFNISIDELMNYSPQLTDPDIKKLYHRLAKDFSEKPFEEVYEEWEAVIKKYYSCFSLLLQMCTLMVNHYMLAEGKARQKELLEKIIELCLRIKQENDDTSMATQANQIHGICLLMLNRPAETVDLLEADDCYLTSSHSGLLANAYLALGRKDKAEEVLQGDIYSHLMTIINEVPMLLSINMENPRKAEEIVQRMFSLTDLFNIEKLNFNAVLILCLAAGETYAAFGEQDKAMEYLTRYTDICCNLELPMRIRGDHFFDHIDNTLDKLALGSDAPREERLIRESMICALVENPAFAQLAELPEFQYLLKRLERNKGEEK
mgnify:CR=1 FL=1